MQVSPQALQHQALIAGEAYERLRTLSDAVIDSIPQPSSRTSRKRVDAWLPQPPPLNTDSQVIASTVSDSSLNTCMSTCNSCSFSSFVYSHSDFWLLFQPCSMQNMHSRCGINHSFRVPNIPATVEMGPRPLPLPTSVATQLSAASSVDLLISKSHVIQPYLCGHQHMTMLTWCGTVRIYKGVHIVPSSLVSRKCLTRW